MRRLLMRGLIGDWGVCCLVLVCQLGLLACMVGDVEVMKYEMFVTRYSRPIERVNIMADKDGELPHSLRGNIICELID